jgi:putative transposase
MARVVAEAVPHHITQRGNNRQDTFFLPDDRRYYLETLRAKCRDHGVAVLGYCVMTNHVHLVAVPGAADALAQALGQTHGTYARWFNRRYRRSGHLWQNRFYSSALGGGYLETALAYVDLNPVRAKLVKHAEEYEWSSAKAHLGGCEADALIDSWDWAELGFGANWAERLAARGAADQGEMLREATYAGRPFGDEKFVADLERRVNRPLTKGKPGRKPKALAAGAGAHA